MAALQLWGSLHGTARRVRAWQLWALRGGLRTVIVVVDAAAVAAIAISAAHTQWRLTQAAEFVGLLACGALLIESTRTIREVHGSIVRDLQPVWYLAIAIALPPAYAYAAPVPLLAYKLWRTPGLVIYRRVFSNATISLGYGTAAWLFHQVPPAVAGPVPGAGLHVMTWAGVATGTGVLGWLINDGLIVVAIKLADPVAGVRELVINTSAMSADLIELSLGVSLAFIIAINPVLMVLALPSVLLYRRYMMSAQLVAEGRIDAKTGLLNSRTWRREAEVEVARGLRERASPAVVMVAVDHFASVTGAAGRQAGDQVLRAIAGTMNEQLSGAGLIGRLGLEEFVILLPGTSPEEVRQASTRLRNHIAAQPIPVYTGSHADGMFWLTVSVGIATQARSRRTLAELVQGADSALAQARRTGRGALCMAPVDAEPLPPACGM